MKNKFCFFIIIVFFCSCARVIVLPNGCKQYTYPTLSHKARHHSF